ncbi:alpha/beta fold hydrolase [Pontivivens insulae]|uniref:Palmitoyl-protein thioesterase ABHD10, mitochondrial n=1 Tax=Pontivivens insulae TaxID=1639689 RepID=A0A2R8ACM2_9RHOB|nr:alpha/beta hydrolase [Pontivivens insulae]RED13932.1 pimeloyl-ACP methyl ester carboxylesterase [Pontivivens insulae]SPF30006.1 hypothetical protein POI8812_02334 [Pontivivens insulae]
MQDHSVFEPDGQRKIAYHRTMAEGEGVGKPGIVFLGGYSSDMTGTKAVWLEEWARARGRAFLRFDYQAHGASSGDWADGSIGAWSQDAFDIIAAMTEGPQILVGSSMGGWMSLLTARKLPDRVAGIVGIAAAPDFTEDGMYADFTEDQREMLERDGQIALESDYDPEPYIVTKHFIEEGRNNLVLRSPLSLPFPVRFLHGTADTDVPYTRAMDTLHHADCPDFRVVLVKDADHRFSSEPCLQLIGEMVDQIS